MIRRLHPDVDVHEICRERSQIDAALDRAEHSARLRHKQLGVPLVVWRDGQVVEIPPEEIVVDPPEENREHQPDA
jgi:hypothetical protein